MASTRRKSAAVALAVVGIAGLSLASAATLNVNSASLGAGNEIVAACQPDDGDPSTADGIAVGFENAYGTAAYTTTGVTLSNVAAACDGLDVRVTIADAAGVSLHEFVGTIATGGTTTLTGATELAADVENVSVVISG